MGLNGGSRTRAAVDPHSHSSLAHAPGFNEASPTTPITWSETVAGTTLCRRGEQGAPSSTFLLRPSLAFERAHAAALVVLDRLADLGVGVHHEGPVADDRLVDRLAGHQEQPGILLRLEGYRLALPVQDRELGLLQRARSVDR